jgi:hypothetical protein
MEQPAPSPRTRVLGLQCQQPREAVRHKAALQLKLLQQHAQQGWRRAARLLLLLLLLSQQPVEAPVHAAAAHQVLGVVAAAALHAGASRTPCFLSMVLPVAHAAGWVGGEFVGCKLRAWRACSAAGPRHGVTHRQCCAAADVLRRSSR